MSPEAPGDLGSTGTDLWNELVYERKLGAVHLSLIHNCCRLADNLDEFAESYQGNLVVTDDVGTEVANPLLVEFRQQFLAMRQVLKDLNLMELPRGESEVEVDPMADWAEKMGIKRR